jgi:hypothetical protein
MPVRIGGGDAPEAEAQVGKCVPILGPNRQRSLAGRLGFLDQPQLTKRGPIVVPIDRLRVANRKRPFDFRFCLLVLSFCETGQPQQVPRTRVVWRFFKNGTVYLLRAGKITVLVPCETSFQVGSDGFHRGAFAQKQTPCPYHPY